MVMTRRERLRRCYSNREVDRPGVYVRTGFPSDDPTYAPLKAYLQTHTELKAGWASPQLESAPHIESSVEPHSEDFQRRIEILHTPKADLRRTALVSLKGQPGLHETFFVNSPEDAEAYLSLPLPETGGDVSSFAAARAAVGDAGIVSVSLGHNPAGFVAELCGSENFALLSVTARGLLHRLCERRMDALVRRVTFLLDGGVGPFFAMAGEECVVPPLHGPRDFTDFNVRYDTPIIDLIHDSGGRVHIHCHGSIRAVLQGFIDMEVDVLHPFEPPPQGNITAREAKDIVRGRMCIEGNIQINRMYEASPDDVRHETEQLIADAFDDGKGLIVCPTASPYVRGQGEQAFPRFKAMIDTVLAYGA